MCKSATSTITEQAISISVRNASHALTAALTELRTAALKAQQTGNSTEIDAALEQVSGHSQFQEKGSAPKNMLVKFVLNNSNAHYL